MRPHTFQRGKLIHEFDGLVARSLQLQLEHRRVTRAVLEVESFRQYRGNAFAPVGHRRGQRKQLLVFLLDQFVLRERHIVKCVHDATGSQHAVVSASSTEEQTEQFLHLLVASRCGD